ncbi:N-6 DNA methylase [Methanobrevibacter sp.]|uniref:N-6 DNA methylase n=1 Tax=Methanobrevibacter sp. TaxID=66852 RepID=UPI00386AD74B
MRKTKSHNENILNYLIRNGRRLKSSNNANYLMLYAFLYKYLSDKLKHHLLNQFGASGDDLRIFYMTDEGKAEIREIALNDLGYFIESYDVYIDQFIGNAFIDDLIDPRFLLDLKKNIVFSKNNPCEKYFKTIVEYVEKQTRFYRMSYDAEQELLVSNFLLYVSKLDIEESELTFRKCYDLIASARQIRLIRTPEYITQILEKIITTEKDSAQSVYDPFMRDGANLISVSNALGSLVYGKESNELFYFYTLIKAFIYEYDFDRVFLRQEDAIEAMSFDDELFDVIVSKIPNRYSKDVYPRQNLEAPNPNKKDIKEQVISKYDLSELVEDEELLNALSVLEKKVESVEKNNIIHFDDEYKHLIESEFLFVINMINSLKEDGIMAISVSQNFLFKKSLTKLRKFLTYENNYIDTIISLPEDLSRSIRPEVIIVFKKNRNRDDILFIDFSKDYDLVRPKNVVPGVFKRNLILDEKTLNKVMDVFTKRKTIEKFSQLISLNELGENDFNLTVSRYVDTYEGIFVNLKDLKKDKHEIDEKMDELNKKIDKMMAELDIRL